MNSTSPLARDPGNTSTTSSPRSIVPFNFGDNLVRAIEQNGEPWFVAKDVCNALEIKDTSMAVSRLEEDEKGTSQIGTLGGKQNVSIISESGLYSLVLRSDKPQAKPFRKWVTSEVLPTIRKTGQYSTQPQALNMDLFLETFRKEIFPSVLRPLVDELVTAKLQNDSRVTVESMFSARQILDQEKVPSKGRRGLVVAVSHSLRDFCLQTGACAKRCSRTGTWLYPIEIKQNWLKKAGRSLIEDHRSATFGQLKLDLVPMPDVRKEGAVQ